MCKEDKENVQESKSVEVKQRKERMSYNT